MIHLKIDNSVSSISGLSLKQLTELRELLSYTPDPQATFFSGRGPVRRYLIDKHGNYPSGLNYIVKRYLLSTQQQFHLEDKRICPITRLNALQATFSLKPYPDQLDAVTIALRAKQGVITMPTGSGKSITMAILVNELKLKTLIVVPNIELKRQLSETFIEIFGNLLHVTIENIDSAALQRPGKYDCLIIDEAHHSAAKTYRTLNKKHWGGIYYRFFFTATPFRSRDEETLLYESICGQVIYRLTYKDAVAKGFIVPIEAYYYDLPKSDINGYTWPQVYEELIVSNKGRNELIAWILKRCKDSNLSTLCLVKEIKHGNALSRASGLPFIEGSGDRTLIPKFNERKIPVLIGTNGVMGEGIDTKPAEFVIICGLGKSKNQFMQQVGRCVRRYPGKESGKVIIFRDRSHKFGLTHFNAERKILLDEYGVVPTKLEIT